MVTVKFEEKSNFEYIISVKLAFLNFNLPPILVEGLCMHTKICSTQLIVIFQIL